MDLKTHLTGKSAFIFGLDQVLYPEKDYLLQVYYLFAEFMEYTMQVNASSIIEFMQSAYLNEGTENIFEKTAAKFNLPEKYKQNFELLHETARLPLKLLLFQNILSFLQEIVIERKQIYLLITGNPAIQLNKIKQMEWHGLEKYLKVYFSEEFEPSLSKKTVDVIIEQHELSNKDILYIGSGNQEQNICQEANIDFLLATKLI